MILLYSIFAISVLLGGLIATLSMSQLDSANSNISSFQYMPENDSQNSIY
jgi:hypothetical protein